VESSTVDVAVLGAGIAGGALAYHLAVAGVTPVALLDPRPPAAGASGRAAGIVTEQLWNEWDVEVTRESHREYAALCGRLRPSAHRRNGFLRFTTDPSAQEALRSGHERLRQWRVPTELLGPAEIRRLLPEARCEEGVLGLYSAADGCVDPATLTALYVEEAGRLGVSVQVGTEVRLRGREGAHWIVATASGDVRARRLVLAAGAWTKRIAGELGHPLPLAPYRTQAALLRPEAAARHDLPSSHDIDRDVYVRPEEHGRLVAGDGTELVEVDPERVSYGASEAFVEHLAEALAASWPAWGDSAVEGAWAGVCTSTPDRRPLIGEIPGENGLYAITGFNGFGVMRAAGAARRLAVLLAEAEGSAEGRELLAPVDPARFAGPPRPFAPRPGFTLEGGDAPRF
jgi:glycine/D-amino acid oxidase-like deaminating enzyme